MDLFVNVHGFNMSQQEAVVNQTAWINAVVECVQRIGHDLYVQV